MKNDPIRFNVHLSTTFRRRVKNWKTKKHFGFLLKTDLQPPQKKSVRSYESYDFSTFHCFRNLEKIIHRKLDSP